MSPLRVLTTTWPTSLTCRPRRELLPHWKSTTCRRDQRASFLWQLKKTTFNFEGIEFWAIWRLPFNPRRSLNVYMMVMSPSPDRLTHGRCCHRYDHPFAAPCQYWRSGYMEISFERRCAAVFAGWNIRISPSQAWKSYYVYNLYTYTSVMFCILLCCSLLLVWLTITKPKHEEVCNLCNLCNLRHVEKHLCKESGDEVFSFGGPVGWIRKSGQNLQTSLHPWVVICFCCLCRLLEMSFQGCFAFVSVNLDDNTANDMNNSELSYE